MSITDELRKYAGRLSDEAARKSEHGFSPVAMALEGIADRIDVEHEAACAEAYGNGVMSVPIALDESQWVKLPVDADGVPIRVGDVLTDGEYTFTVCELAAFGGGSWSIRNDDGSAWKACDVTHHHKPTVEDVLREFAYGLGVPVADSYIAASAAKLRLAGDAE